MKFIVKIFNFSCLNIQLVLNVIFTSGFFKNKWKKCSISRKEPIYCFSLEIRFLARVKRKDLVKNYFPESAFKWENKYDTVYTSEF